MLHTCHCPGQLDKCREVAERCESTFYTFSVLPSMHRGEQVMQGEAMGKVNEGGGGEGR